MLTLELCDERIAKLWERYKRHDGDEHQQVLIMNELNTWLDTRSTVTRERELAGATST